MSASDDSTEPGILEQTGDIIRTVLEYYQRSPVLRMLVKLHPKLVVAEAGILGAYSWFQNERLHVFAEEFTTLNLNISEDDAKRKEFFNAYMSTADHVLRESRDAKIRLFARLFGEFVRHGCSTPIDEYEERLQLLDEISEKEFKLLLLLEHHEAKHPIQPNENALQRAKRIWAAFEPAAEKQLGLDTDRLQSALVRLTRTGFYHEITGTYLDYTGGRGYLSTTFKEFVRALGISTETAAASLAFTSPRSPAPAFPE